MSLFAMCMMANGYLGFKIIVPRLLDYGQIAFCCYYFHGITVVSVELTIINFSIVFFLPITSLLLRCLSPVSNSFYLYTFFNSSPTLSKLL